MTVPAVYQFDFTASLPLESPFRGAVAIYVLSEPTDPLAVRYVGKSSRPIVRIKTHCAPSALRKGNRCAAWIAELVRAGQQPMMRVICWVSVEHWQVCERQAIAAARVLVGERLTNTRHGGGSGPQPLSAAHRAAISAGLKGRKHSPEHVEAVRRANLGKGRSAAWSAKQSAAHKGKPYSEAQRKAREGKTFHHTPQARAAISAGLLGRPVSAATRERIAAGHRGKPCAPETRAKISATLKARARSQPSSPVGA